MNLLTRLKRGFRNIPIATKIGLSTLVTLVPGIVLVVVYLARASQDNTLEQAVVSTKAIGFLAVASGLTTVLLVFLISRLVGQRLKQMVRVLNSVAGGDLTKRLDIDSQDEVGHLAAALNRAMEALRAAAEQEKELALQHWVQVDKDRRQAEQEQAAVELEKQQAEEIRQQKVDSILEVVEAVSGGDLTRRVTVGGNDAIGRMAGGLNKLIADLRSSVTAIGQNALTLGASGEQLAVVSTEMSANAEQTAVQANVVSAVSGHVSKNVHTVAASVEEMGASIREIAKNAAEAARIATAAVAAADSANSTITKLGASSAEIGKVLKVITRIADQTNLLALNATIEAARAGDAGKGFAVVANEVKELAKETAKATDDIGRMTEAIQTDTQGAVAAIREIGAVINQVNDISSTIASAVDQQTATTNEIGRSVAEAAKGAGEITQNIAAVAKAARGTTGGALNTLKAAQELARMAAALENLIVQFKYELNEPAASRSLPAKQGAQAARQALTNDAGRFHSKRQGNGHARSVMGKFSS